MTKKEMYANIATLLSDNAEIVEFCEHEISLLNARKSEGDAKKKAETAQRAEAVYEVLANAPEAMTVTDIIATATNEVAGYTNQRVSALLRILIKAGRVEKTIEKKKAFFKVAE